MKNQKHVSIALAMLISAASGFAQSTPSPTKAGETPAGSSSTGTTNSGEVAKRTVSENASDNAKAVQVVLMQFDERRDAIMSERRAIIRRLREAKTEEDRMTITEQLRTEKKALADEQRALGKEIREELKKLRDQRKGGGG